MSKRHLTVILTLVVVLCGCSGSDEVATRGQAPARIVPPASLPPSLAPHAEDEAPEDQVDEAPGDGDEVNENIFTAPKIPVQPVTPKGPASTGSTGPLVALPTIQLVGFMAVDGSKALLRVDGKRIISKIGDSFQNVEIIEVAAPKITLKLRGEEYTLDLTANYRLDPNQDGSAPRKTDVPRPSRRPPEPGPSLSGAAKLPAVGVDVPQLPPLPGLGNDVSLPPLPRRQSAGPMSGADASNSGLRVPNLVQ